MTYSALCYDVSDGIARVGLNRPEAHNAIDERMARELADAALRASEDGSVRVAILRGEGNKDERFVFVMDEAGGVDGTFWTTTKTMWKPELGHIWLAILNPTNTTTPAYLEDQGGGWRVFSLSCLDHPPDGCSPRRARTGHRFTQHGAEGRRLPR